MKEIKPATEKRELIFLLFVTNALAMLLELVAARILSPYFGSSNFVWTIIISIMLLSNTAGNLIGGRLSDKKDLMKVTGMIMCSVTISSFLIAHINGNMLNSLQSGKTEAIFTVILLTIPCIMIGALSPVINKAYLSSDEDMGKKSGFIYAVITAGSLIGTLLGGLWLIPNFGCRNILYGTVIFLSILLAEGSVTHRNAHLGLLGILLIVFTIMSIKTSENASTGVIYEDTDEGYVRIYTAEYEGEKIRVFDVSGAFESGCYLDEEKRNELVFPYLKGYNVILDRKEDARTYCMIGGAGYSYPRYLISHYKDKTIDTVEIDKGVTRVARKYFFLDDFLAEYGTERFGIYNEDGRLFLSRKEKRYDVILNDAFSGKIPARTLASVEAVNIIHSSLNEGGIYAANLVNYGNIFFNSEIKTVRSVFRYIWLIPINEKQYILIASDTDYGFNDKDINVEDGIILTDDYCPVE